MPSAMFGQQQALTNTIFLLPSFCALPSRPENRENWEENAGGPVSNSTQKPMKIGPDSGQRAGGQGGQPGPRDQREFHYPEVGVFFSTK